MTPAARLLALDQLHIQGRHDFLHDLIVQCEEIALGAIKALSPNVFSGSGIHQLRRDPQSVTQFLHAALQHMAHAQLLADLPDINRLAFVTEAGVAGDHQHPA